MEQDGTTDAGAAPGGAARPRGRGHASRRRPGAWTVGVVIVSVLAGGLFALSATTADGVPLRAETADQVDLLRRAAQENQRLAERVRLVEQENARSVARDGAADSEVAALTRARDRLAPQAGFAPVTGPVLQVTLDDAPRGGAVAPGVTPDDLVVHQQDVQAVVNALWRGGAEAMMLMDQRVISTSAVRCVGNTLILQGRVYSPPYVIKAIGDVRGMQDALLLSPEVGIYRQFVQLVKLGYRVEEPGPQTFPAFDGASSLEFARPVDEPSAAPAGTSDAPAEEQPGGSTGGSSGP